MLSKELAPGLPGLTPTRTSLDLLLLFLPLPRPFWHLFLTWCSRRSPRPQGPPLLHLGTGLVSSPLWRGLSVPRLPQGTPRTGGFT